jgi:hypothetical protein
MDGLPGIHHDPGGGAYSFAPYLSDPNGGVYTVIASPGSAQFPSGSIVGRSGIFQAGTAAPGTYDALQLRASNGRGQFADMPFFFSLTIQSPVQTATIAIRQGECINLTYILPAPPAGKKRQTILAGTSISSIADRRLDQKHKRQSIWRTP